MTESYTAAGGLDPGLVGESWALVIGGATRAGNRRARRSVARARQLGLDVVWLDGFEETFPGTNERVPLQDQTGTGSLVVVGYEAAESETVSGRLRLGQRWHGNPVSRRLWRLFLRRLGSVLRPRAGWKVVREDVEALTHHPTPAAIVYSDDYAITIAWHAGRIWRSAPILSSFPEAG